MLSWLLTAIGLHAASGLPCLLMPRNARLGQWASALVSVVASGLGLAATIGWLIEPTDATLVVPWPLLPGVDFFVSVDTLSAVFLLPIFLVAGLGSIYGLGYWRQPEHPENGRKLCAAYGVLVAGMATLVIARNSILFIFGWEAMALSAYFLVTTEDHEPQVRETGWVYLVSTHVATLLLFVLLGLLHALTGSYEFGLPLRPEVLASPVAGHALFAIALVAFGLKAGLIPLHVWLPNAHANAPSHVSAIMSGVIIKMGVYGLVRVLMMLPEVSFWWGAVLLVLGLMSGLLGIAFGLGQADLKRVLAYSSIENIGVIFVGLGLAVIGRAAGRNDWLVLGLGGALFHVWNHALFKSLLFYGAGAIVHAVHTRRIDQLGGLAKKMPRTALLVLGGVVAACALPPLNGMASEFLIYLGLFRALMNTASEGASNALPALAMVAPALALIGALVVACYTVWYGTMFLGAARSEQTRRAHDPGWLMLGPMAVQLLACLALGLAPAAVASVWERVAADFAPRVAAVPLLELAPLRMLSVAGGLLFGLSAVLGLWLRWSLQQASVERSGTWGCGYAAPTPRMQYTSSSLAQILVDLFGWALQPRRHLPRIRTLFPHAAAFSVEVTDVVLERVAWPASRWLADALSWFRLLQQGNVQAYLMYILVVLVFLLFWE